MTASSYGLEPGMGAPAPVPDEQGRRAEKRRATLVAELALRGHELKQPEAGTYSVHRWGLSRALDSLDAVAGFARQVGVQYG
jgi:hypothetical protein